MDKEWIETVKQIPHDVVKKWLSEEFPGLEELKFHDDVENEGLWTWVYKTLCGHLSYNDPPAWFVFKSCRYNNSAVSTNRIRCATCGKRIYPAKEVFHTLLKAGKHECHECFSSKCGDCDTCGSPCF